MNNIKLNWQDFKTTIIDKNLGIQYYVKGIFYYLIAFDANLTFTCEIEQNTPRSSEQIDFEDNFKLLSTTNSNITNNVLVSGQNPFASKVLPNGQKIFKRVHGVKHVLSSATDVIRFTVPYTQCKITGIEILGANFGDTANFNVYDTSSGTLSTIPNFKLNQFGFDVNIKPSHHVENSEYDADLIQGLVLEVEITGITGQEVLINFILHEVK